MPYRRLNQSDYIRAEVLALYHKAAHVRADGAVSPLCARRPRAMNLRRELWTLRWEAVTCARCLALKPKEPECPTND